MDSVGAFLKYGREKRGSSIEEIAETTKIQPYLLRALEGDDFERLPSPVFVKGFIRMYCKTVGCDPATALELYQSVIDGRHDELPPMVRTATEVKTMSNQTRISPMLLLAVALLILIIGFFTFQFSSREELETSSLVTPDIQIEQLNTLTDTITSKSSQ